MQFERQLGSLAASGDAIFATPSSPSSSAASASQLDDGGVANSPLSQHTPTQSANDVTHGHPPLQKSSVGPVRPGRKARIRPDDLTCTCSECGAVFGHPSRLKRHMNSMHLNVKPFGCRICGFRSGYQGALYNHLKNLHHIAKEEVRNYIQGTATFKMLCSMLPRVHDNDIGDLQMYETFRDFNEESVSHGNIKASH